MINKFANLSYFFSHFHQDWELDARNPEEVFDLFVRENPVETVSRAVCELEEFLSMDLSDGELEHTLYCELGCYYMPDKSVREWLVFVRESLTNLMKGR